MHPRALRDPVIYGETMFKTVFWSSLLVGLVAAVGVHAYPVTLTPSTQTVNVGDVVTVDLQISGLGIGSAPSLGVFDIDFGFDPALLSLSSVLYGIGLDVMGLGSLQATTPGVGSVNLFELSFDSADDLNALQSDSFTLATLNFNAIALGSGFFSLSFNAVGDAYGDALAVTSLGGSVTVAAAVPEPETWALVLAALVMLGLTTHRGKSLVN